MADRTVRVRLKADISDFVSGMVKAEAAINRLERAASGADKRIATVGSSSKIQDLGSKADAVGQKLDKAGTSGETAGRKISGAAQKSSADLKKLADAVDRVNKSTDEQTKAIDRTSKSADAQANAIGRLRTAQLRLIEAQKSGKGGASLAGAEESVAAAERAVKKFEDAGSKSGKGFVSKLGSTLKKWVSGDGTSVFKQLGQNVGGGFLASLAGALKTPIIGPILAVALLAAVTSVAVPAGAALAGGVVAGFGTGIAALGLKFAAESQVVGHIWSKTVTDMGVQMRSISKPLETTLNVLAVVAQRTFATFKPQLAAAFKSLAPVLSSFGDQLGQALGKLAPAVRPLTDAFSHVLAALGPALNDMFSQLSSSLIKLSDSISKNPTALADFTRGLGGLVSDLLGFLTIMNNADAAFKRWTGGVSAVTALMGTLRGAVDIVLGPIEGLAQGLSGVGDGMNWLAGKLGIGKQVMDQAGASTGTFSANLLKTANSLVAQTQAAEHSAHANHQANVEAALAAGAFDRQTAATQRAIDALNRYSDRLLAQRNAQLGYAQAVADATQAIKDNGHTHDLATQKGRDNYRALLQVAQAADAQRDAMIKAGAGTAAAAKTTESAKAKFIRLAEQMGYGAAEARKMADDLIKIPNVTRTARLQANITDLETKLATAKTKLGDKKLTATQRSKLEVYIKQLEDGIAKAKRDLASVPPSKNVSITTTFTEIHRVVGGGSKSSSGGVGGGHEVQARGQADGGFYPGGVPAYANGKLPNQAMVAPGRGRGLVQWAEAETGGEAFIPLAPSKRDRSEKILGQVANTFGMSLVKSFASGGFLPGSGQLVDIQYLLQQLNIPFNPLAGINYSGTLTVANRANRAVIPARTAAIEAQRAEDAAKKQVAAIQRAITLQQRAINAARAPKQTTKAGQKAEDARVAAEQKKLIKLQDELYAAKNKATAATKASSAADAAYKVKVDAATKANEAHKASIEALIEQQKAAVEMAQQISTNLQQGANIGDLFQQSLTGKGLLADLRGQGADLAKFNTLISKLRKAGLDEGLIGQIIGKGAAGGTDVAQAILSGGLALINSLNKAQWALEASANAIGAGAATAQYGKQVFGRRAMGGPTLPGKAYVVGEDGPEVLRMGSQGGWVQPNRYITHNTQAATYVTEVHQHFTFTDASRSEVELVASRAKAKLEFAARS